MCVSVRFSAGAREGVLCRGCCGGGWGGGCVRQQLAILQMGIGYNEFITMFYIQATFKLKNP